MMLGLKITCTCYQEKTAICCQTPLVVPIAVKNVHRWVFQHAVSKFQSALLSDQSRHTNLI